MGAEKKSRAVSLVSRHTEKVDALLTEAALCFTLAFCELDASSWHDDVQYTEDQAERTRLLQMLLEGCIAEQPAGAAMTIQDMHTAWSAHVRLLPQEAPYVDAPV